MKRYRVDVETGRDGHFGSTQVTVDCSDDHTALAFIAKLGQMLTDGDYELTCEERRTV